MYARPYARVRRTQFILSARGRDIFPTRRRGCTRLAVDFQRDGERCCDGRADGRAVFQTLPLSRGHSGKFWARWSHEGRKRGTDNFTTTTGSGLRVRPVAAAQRRLAIGPPAGSSIRVFYRTGVHRARRRARNKRAPRSRTGLPARRRRRRGVCFRFLATDFASRSFRTIRNLHLTSAQIYSKFYLRIRICVLRHIFQHIPIPNYQKPNYHRCPRKQYTFHFFNTMRCWQTFSR